MYELAEFCQKSIQTLLEIHPNYVEIVTNFLKLQKCVQTLPKIYPNIVEIVKKVLNLLKSIQHS
jgi:regulator of sigma D